MPPLALEDIRSYGDGVIPDFQPAIPNSVREPPPRLRGAGDADRGARASSSSRSIHSSAKAKTARSL
jgi:hypothetical protein